MGLVDKVLWLLVGLLGAAVVVAWLLFAAATRDTERAAWAVLGVGALAAVMVLAVDLDPVRRARRRAKKK